MLQKVMSCRFMNMSVPTAAVSLNCSFVVGKNRIVRVATASRWKNSLA